MQKFISSPCGELRSNSWGVSAKPDSLKPPFFKGGKSLKATERCWEYNPFTAAASKMEGNNPLIGVADSILASRSDSSRVASRRITGEPYCLYVLCRLSRKMDSRSKALQRLRRHDSPPCLEHTASLLQTDAIGKPGPRLRPHESRRDPQKAHFWVLFLSAGKVPPVPLLRDAGTPPCGWGRTFSSPAQLRQ